MVTPSSSPLYPSGEDKPAEEGLPLLEEATLAPAAPYICANCQTLQPREGRSDGQVVCQSCQMIIAPGEVYMVGVSTGPRHLQGCASRV